MKAQLASTLSDLEAVLEQQRRTVYVPTDVLFSALPMVLPPERMLVAAGERTLGSTTVRALYDVTDAAHSTRFHVQADPVKLRRALISFEHAGSQLAAWIHSHPGQGPRATTPSNIDFASYASWVADYPDELLGIIFSEDRFVRFWGSALDSGRTRVEFIGSGVTPVAGHAHVFELAG